MTSPNPSRRTCVVTGAAGFIGFHLCSRLFEEGCDVVGVDNFDPFYDRAVKQKNLADLAALATARGVRFRCEERDILDMTPGSVVSGPVDVVFHWAARAGVRPSLKDPAGYARVNVQGTVQVLEWARAVGARVVFASSSSVYGDNSPAPFREDAPADKPVSPYAASKRACEHFCAAHAHVHGMRVAALRLFTVYGPRQRPDLAIHSFARNMLAGRPIQLFGDGSTARDYTFVLDIVAGIMAADDWLVQQPAGTMDVFNLGGSRTTTLLEMVEALEKALGITAQRTWAPPQPGDVRLTSADVSKAARMLGWEPRVPLAEGMARFAQWVKTAH
ncbi:MAG: GDP-mannose 4,6-dehydratase [Deltaproteobacteria bacterium]|nr:GDP-mannose 4,6-dehydratase [Deltaproteobacteria bacterium]